MRQINYMVFKKPHGSKVWTRASDAELAGFAVANLFGRKKNAEGVANGMAEVDGKTHSYTIFECREVGYTCSPGGGRID